MSSSNDNRLFPLALAPFEKYVLAEDSSAYPMSYTFLRLRFSGRFHPQTLQSAFAETLARHPFLRATLTADERNRLTWTAAEGEPQRMRFVDKRPGDDYPDTTAIDLRSEAALRAWCIQPSEGSSAAAADLLVQFHHTACDGVGMAVFVEEVMAAYARGRGGLPSLPPPDQLDANLLRRRGRFDVGWGNRLAFLPRRVLGLARAWRFLTHQPASLTASREVPAGNAFSIRPPTAVSRRFDRRQTEALKDQARSLGVSVNDLLLRDLLVALRYWRSKHEPGNDRDWLRIMVPKNVRSDGDRRMPAANKISLLFIDRRQADTADPDALLRSVRREMDRIKRWQLGLTFVQGLAVACLFPGVLRRLVRSDRCQSSTLLTNWGHVYFRSPLAGSEGQIDLGDAVLESISVLPPLRPHMCAAFSTCCYAGRQLFTLNYDGRVLSRPEAEALIDAFEGQASK